MLATKTLLQAAAHAERTPMIRFIGKRTIPSSVDHSPQPHPASPTHSLPPSFASAASQSSAHASFSSYRDHAQQFGPLRKTIKSLEERGIGGTAGAELGRVDAPSGVFFDRSQLPDRFRRAPLTAAEIEAVETGGATMFA